MEEKSVFEEAFNLSVTEQAKAYLKESAKWTKFLSILGFIGIGFMVIAALFMGVIMGSVGGAYNAGAMAGLSSGIITIVYLAMAALYFFPVMYLYKYSVRMKEALQSSNSDTLTEAFSNLKSHYKFIGVLTIVIISLYVLMFVITIGAAAVSGF